MNPDVDDAQWIRFQRRMQQVFYPIIFLLIVGIGITH